jgi:hypothetical protein
MCLALLLFHSASQAQISFNVTTVAAPGDAVPVPSELVFAWTPSVNDSGQVAFTGDGAILVQSNGATRIVAGFGDPAPGGGTFIDAGGPLINASGQIAFGGILQLPGAQESFYGPMAATK